MNEPTKIPQDLTALPTDIAHLQVPPPTETTPPNLRWLRWQVLLLAGISGLVGFLVAQIL